jgi:acetate kinase
VHLAEDRNEIRGREAVISAENSQVKVLVIPTNEELMIAREAATLVGYSEAEGPAALRT